MSEVESRWVEQWSRVKRLFVRFEQIHSGRVHDQESDNYQDDVYAFFQNCYHLKDWLKNDPTSSTVVTDIEGMISASTNLTLCADLCNATKHLKLNRPPRGAETTVGRRHFQLGLTSSLGGSSEEQPPTIAVTYEVDAGGKTFDAFSIARACMLDWETYLNTKGLL